MSSIELDMTQVLKMQKYVNGTLLRMPTVGKCQGNNLIFCVVIAGPDMHYYDIYALRSGVLHLHVFENLRQISYAFVS